MSNVITLKPRLRQTTSQRQGRLLASFAHQRRLPDDVFWLKENAEFLGILAATGATPDTDALAPFEEFYEGLAERMRFFPQYYRFLLSIALDLEDLGMPGNLGSTLCARAAREGFVDAELSDLQRAEACRLLARRNTGHDADAGLNDRLHGFISRAATFAMPNKKAAYELTHIVFYLSEYGAQNPQLSDAALTSLTYAGLLAYLDQNADLLAEVCTALRFAGQTPSPLWERAVAHAHQQTVLSEDAQGALNDAYHEYLVTGWMMQVANIGGFDGDVPEGSVRFGRAYVPQGALRTLSECMFQLGDQRSGDWQQMRGLVMPLLGPDGHDVLHTAEQSTDVFEPFFERFARAGGM